VGEGGSLHLHFFNDTRVCIIAASELVEWRLSRLAFISYELKLNVLFLFGGLCCVVLLSCYDIVARLLEN